MARSVRISEETAEVINELGGTFDSPDDVIQQLIREAGHGERLQSKQTSNEDNEKMSSRERKSQFIKKIDDHGNVQKVEKHGRSSWKVTTDSREKIVWVHYHTDFEFWGGGWEMTGKLLNIAPLVHAFVGPKEDQYYVVPDDDLHDGRFTVYDTEDESDWKFNINRGDNEKLLSNYTSLDPIIK